MSSRSNPLQALLALEPVTWPGDDAQTEAALRRATMLSLAGKRISQLPACIGELTNLQGLWIYDNPDLTELPDSITRLKRLSRLQIERDGQISLQCVPEGLKQLSCYQNTEKPWGDMKFNFSEALAKPTCRKNYGENIKDVEGLLYKWAFCDQLDLSHNQIKSLPDSFSSLFSLVQLNLSRNQLSEFPNVLCKMTWLVHLDIAYNSILCLPNEFTNLFKLESLITHEAGASCTHVQYAPAGFMTMLCYKNDWKRKEINFYYKNTTGRLSCLDNLVDLLARCQEIDIACNLVSFLPESLTSATALTKLDISYNKFVEFPQIIFHLTNLNELNITGNQIVCLPLEFTTMTNLTALTTFDGNSSLLKLAPVHILSMKIIHKSDPDELKFFGEYSNQGLENIDSRKRLEDCYFVNLSRNRIIELPQRLASCKKLRELDISHNQLTKFPTVLNQLKDLIYLNIAGNKISHLPEEMAAMSSLKRLVISDCYHPHRLSTVPLCLTNLHFYSDNPELRQLPIAFKVRKASQLEEHTSSLQNCNVIYASSAQLSTLPLSLTSLKALGSIDISSNLFHEFPEALLHMTWITSINIAGNKITTLPDGFTKLKMLRELVFNDEGGYRLKRVPEGVVNMECYTAFQNHPEFSFYTIQKGRSLTSVNHLLSRFSNCHEIDLSQNSLEDLPSTFSGLTKLVQLNLSQNKFTTIPLALCALVGLITLDISANEITRLPNYFTCLVGLTSLVVSNSENECFLRLAPLGICQMKCYENGTKLKGLQFYEEQTGKNITCIDSLIPWLQSCCEVNFSNNKISTIPDKITELTSVTKLDLSDNMFSTFPMILNSLTWLLELNLVGNEITELPQEFTSLTKLTKFSVSRGHAIPKLLFAPIGLTSMPCYAGDTCLSQVQFKAHLIAQNLRDIGDQVNLWGRCIEINLSQNELTSLPVSFSSLIRLKNLDLSQNQFAELPSSLCQMSWLQSLHLSVNKLSALPARLPRLNSLTLLDLSKNKLALFPEAVHDLPSLIHLDMSGNMITSLPISASRLTNLTFFNIKDPNEGARLIVAPDFVTKMPNIWKEDMTKARIHLRDAYQGGEDMFEIMNQTTAMFVRLRQYVDIQDVREDSHLEEKIKLATLPLLLKSEVEQVITLNERTSRLEPWLCFLCFQKVEDARKTPCNHIFCGKCLADATKDFPHKGPYACPICHSAISSAGNIVRVHPRTRRCRCSKITSSKPRKDDDSGGEGKKPLNTSPKEKDQQRGNKKQTSKPCKRICTCSGDSRDSERNSDTDDESSGGGSSDDGSDEDDDNHYCKLHRREIMYIVPDCIDRPLQCADCLLEMQAQARGASLGALDFDRNTEAVMRIMQKQKDDIRSKLDNVDYNLTLLSRERQRFNDAKMRAKYELDVKLKELQRLVEEFSEATNSHFRHLQGEFDQEIERKTREMELEKKKLEVAKILMDRYCGRNPAETAKTKLSDVLSFCGKVSRSNVAHVAFNPRAFQMDFPEDLLDKLRALKTEMFIYLKISEPKTSLSDPFSEVGSLWNVHRDNKTKSTYAADETLSEIVVFDARNRVTQKANISIAIRNGLNSVRGICVSQTGIVAVANSMAHYVSLHRSADLSLLRVIRHYDLWDSTRKGNERTLISPCAVAFNHKNQLIIADSSSRQVLLFNPTYSSAHEIMSIARFVKDVNLVPVSICMNEKNELLVLCAGSDRVLIFDIDFTWRGNVIIEKINSLGFASINYACYGHFSIWDMHKNTACFYNYDGVVVSNIRT